ncbi:hypothetical protein [Ramlibacter sp.]|uniref:hypothetical protein n=1 Tax=Ramlibacter sp. TaxID=1917967 RepID=UPI002B707289|nr:hypothetical protein [Ramlibacter sp.]HWI82607.1 hypothetical protein [Ramlibacter sp.]
MTIDLPASSSQPEGTGLPPPRGFGDANTLTLPRARRPAMAQGVLLGAPVARAAGEALQVAIVPAEGTPLTLTF